MGEFLFYPSVLALLGVILAVLTAANYVNRKWLCNKNPVPILPTFSESLFPTLLFSWMLILALFVRFGWDFLPAVGIWATVSTIMLWPVGKEVGRSYFSYRNPLFILGVLSMAGLPLLGLFLQILPPTSRVNPELTRTWLLLVVVADLTIFSIVAATKTAITKPIAMFFRPDILFGDGRILGTGMIALGLSMRFLFADVPEKFPHIPAPVGNWWGIYFAIAFGLLQIIPLRGMVKLLMRAARMTQNKWGGWGAVILRESWLVLASLSLLYGFHNVFGGKIPTQSDYWFLNGLMPEHFSEAGFPGLISLVLAALFIIFVRGGYKKYIGDPFFKETLGQSIIKQILFLIGFIWLFYSFAHVMEEKPFFSGPTPIEMWPAALIGWSLFFWGVLMLGPIRIWAQRNQRIGIVKQMAAVFLPASDRETRERVLEKMMNGLVSLPEKERLTLMMAMQEAISEADEDVQKIMTDSRMEVLSKLSSEKRKIIMGTMDKLMLGT